MAGESYGVSIQSATKGCIWRIALQANFGKEKNITEAAIFRSDYGVRLGSFCCCCLLLRRLGDISGYNMVEWVKNIGNGVELADVFLLAVFVLLALLLLLKRMGSAVRRLPAREDMPRYALIYADQKQGRGGKENFGKLLYSAKYELQGKPDYVFCSRICKKIVPVELKSGNIGEAEEPHRGDLLQLGAYFLILEDVYGKKPAKGRIVYRDGMFEIKNTAKIRREVLTTVKEMREMLQYGTGRAKPDFAHCRPCICNGTVCRFSATEIEGAEHDSDRKK